MTPRDPETVSGPTPWVSVLLAAALAAVIAWLLGESRLALVAPEKTDVMLMGVKLRDVTTATVRAAEQRSAAVVFAAFGGVLGLATGGAGGLLRRSPRRAAVAALVGLAAGGAAGALAAFGVLPAYHGLVAGGYAEAWTSLAARAGIWVPVGAGAGLGLGLGLGGRGTVVRAVAGAAAGAMLGVVVFEVVGAVAFPLDHTNQPVSTGPASRLVARLLAAVPVAAGALAAETGNRAVRQAPAGEGAAVGV